MSELNIKSQDNGSTFRATPDTLYMGGVGSAKVDTLHFEVPEEWAGCAITLHVQRLSGAGHRKSRAVGCCWPWTRRGTSP